MPAAVGGGWKKAFIKYLKFKKNQILIDFKR